jgi:hypothetical protein
VQRALLLVVPRRRLLLWRVRLPPRPQLRFRGLPLFRPLAPPLARLQRLWLLVRLQRAVLPLLPLPPQRTALPFPACQQRVPKLLLPPNLLCQPSSPFRANAAFRSR